MINKQISFRKHFNVDDVFMDNMVSYALGKYSFDIIKFDAWLHTAHDYEEKKHGSTADFVKMKFGEEALDFIMELLK